MIKNYKIKRKEVNVMFYNYKTDEMEELPEIRDMMVPVDRFLKLGFLVFEDKEETEEVEEPEEV